MLKPYLMQYIHGDGGGFEPIYFELLRQERLAREKTTELNGMFANGRFHEKSWGAVFEELTQVLSPIQIQQLASRLMMDTKKICLDLHDAAEIEKILAGEHGGES